MSSEPQEPLAPVQATRRAPLWRRFVNRLIACEASSIARYCDELVQWKPRENDDGLLRDLIDAPKKRVARNVEELGEERDTRNFRRAVLLNGNLNHEFDIEQTLGELRQGLSRFSRVLVVAYNPYFRWLYDLACKLRLRKGHIPETFVTNTDLVSLAKLAGYEIVRTRPLIYFPFGLFGLGKLINRFLSLFPFTRIFGLAALYVLRPIIPEATRPSITIVIPARNEKGNIENALKRMPDFGGAPIEVIYVEGHSKDQTWEEIQRVIPLYKGKFSIKAYQQTGKGKSDAVRLGFSQASHDILTILDADLTMPPELLERFYTAYCSGHADFINGSRLVYPMEGNAMKFLNRLGNVFFAKALSFVLGTRLGDSLCGTKLVTRHDYERMGDWREDFGDFDPFGDFELLFPAAELGLGIIDVAIRYRDRVYGTTNIRRFYHGWMLLKMTLIGFFRIRLAKTKMYTEAKF